MTSEEPATAAPAGPAPATFRPLPLPALVAVGVVTIGISPIAFLGGPWFLVFLVPVALAWWVIRTRTVVDENALRSLSVLGSRRIGWDEVTTLRVSDRGWVRAVRDEGEAPLVGVRPRDLGRLAQASGGRISMPTPEEVEEARDHERELEATRLRIARLREREAEETAAEEPDAEARDTPGGSDDARA